MNKKVYIYIAVVLVVLLVGVFAVFKLLFREDDSSEYALPARKVVEQVDLYGIDQDDLPTRAPEKWYEEYHLSGMLLEKPKVVDFEDGIRLLNFKLGMIGRSDRQVTVNLYTPLLPYGDGSGFIIPNDKNTTDELPLNDALIYYGNRVGRVVVIKFTYGIDKTSTEGIYSRIMYGDENDIKNCNTNCFVTMNLLYHRVEETLQTIETLEDRIYEADGKSVFILVDNISIK